jgi:hypothetical protein
MRHLFIFLSLAIFLIACSGKESESDSADSSIAVIPVDTVAEKKSSVDSKIKMYYNTNTQGLNAEGSKTIITSHTEIFKDSLLNNPSGQYLSTGEEITIEAYCGVVVNGNWAEPVYKISYQMGEGSEYGYVSQSKIACTLDTLQSKKIVSLTLDYNQQSNKFVGYVSLITQQGSILGEGKVEFDIYTDGEAPYSYNYYFSFKENEPTGLDGITESFSIDTDYDACGYPGFSYTFLWNGKKLIHCPETFSISEAGQFHQYSYLVFPADSLGRKGCILEIIEGDQYEDGPDDTTQTVNKDSTVIIYKWNKYSFISTPGDTILKKSRTYTINSVY